MRTDIVAYAQHTLTLDIIRDCPGKVARTQGPCNVLIIQHVLQLARVVVVGHVEAERHVRPEVLIFAAQLDVDVSEGQLELELLVRADLVLQDREVLFDGCRVQVVSAVGGIPKVVQRISVDADLANVAGGELVEPAASG